MGRLQRGLGPNGLGGLPEMRFEFSLNLIGKLAMDFLKAYHCAYLNPGTQAGSPEQGFRRCFVYGLNQSVVPSVAQATFFLLSRKVTYYLLIPTYLR